MSNAEPEPITAYERGKMDGETAALLRDHSQHFVTLNGSMADTARELKTMRADFHSDIADLSSAVRTIEEAMRLAAVALETAAETLAKETERRRAELADTTTLGDRKWTKNQQVAAVISPFVLVLIGYLITHFTG